MAYIITIMNLRTRYPLSECDVRVDRSHILGNPFKMEHESQRDKVCDQYERKFHAKETTSLQRLWMNCMLLEQNMVS